MDSGTDNASYSVASSFDTVPMADQSGRIAVTVTNTGTSTWSGYALGSQVFPSGDTNGTGTPLTTGASVAVNGTVAPGGTATAESVTPAENPGSYEICWDMVNAAGTYFSAEGANQYCAPYTVQQYPPQVNEQEPLPGTDVDTQTPALWLQTGTGGIRGATALCALKGMPGPRSLLSLGTALTKRTGREDRPMPGPGELPAQQPAPIIGREAGLARLRALVDPVPQASQVLLVTGEAGMGKTVLLADAADQARSAGMRVLSVTGRESESRLAFAGLHQLLRPVLSGAVGLPARQAQALLGALGLAADPGAANPLLTGVAVLTLLSDLSERSPVLVAADDAHWLDRSSLDALAFAGSRLDAERVVLLVGARGQAPPPGFDRGFPELHLEPLSAADAGLLLDVQPRPPRGRARAQVLAQAAGNPMALIELAKVIADDPAASRRWAAEPLPPSDRLSAVLTSRFAALPEPARAALLLAAVADGPDLRVAASHGAGPDARALAPAEQLGLIKIDRTGLRFSHPLVRSAIYHSAPFARRAAAHRELASAVHDQPDRRAWHLAAAALHTDEHVAALLEATAAQA
jgi:hypothetical protein